MAYNPTNNTFTTLVDLAQQVGTEGAVASVLGGTAFNDGNGGMFYWDGTSTATPNDRVVQVTGVTTGRWMRSRANNYGTSSTTFSGLALTTVYTVNHGQSFTPTQIQLQARTPAASSGLTYVQNITSTTFQIVFSSVPILGTLNITFDFLAVRAN